MIYNLLQAARFAFRMQQGSEGERRVCQESYRAGNSRQGSERHQCRRGAGGRVFPDCGWRQPAGCGFMG